MGRGRYRYRINNGKRRRRKGGEEKHKHTHTHTNWTYLGLMAVIEGIYGMVVVVMAMQSWCLYIYGDALCGVRISGAFHERLCVLAFIKLYSKGMNKENK